MTDRGPRNLRITILGTTVCALLTVLAMVGYVRLFPPAEAPLPPRPFRGYDPATMDAMMTPDAVERQVAELVRLGQRTPVDPGLATCRQWLRDVLTDELHADELIELPLEVLALKTTRARMLDGRGQAIESVRIHPFMPNHFQPPVTPPSGVRGELVLVDDEVLRRRERFDDAIALVDAADPAVGYDFSWAQYAKLGFQAVIVAHRDGFDQVAWHKVCGPAAMVGPMSINFVRVAASPEVFQHVGRTVELDVRVDWVERDAPTLVALFRTGGEAPHEDALMLTTPYDTISCLPDLAPGAVQTAHLAMQINLLRGLLHHRGDLRRDVVAVFHAGQMMDNHGLRQLIAALGRSTDSVEAREKWTRRQTRNAQALEEVEAVLNAFRDPRFLADPGATGQSLADLSPAARERFREQSRYVLNSVVLERSELWLHRRLDFIRLGEPAGDSPALERMIRAKRFHDEAQSASGYFAERLLEERAEYASSIPLRRRVRERFETLAALHRFRTRQYEAILTLNDRLKRYRFLIGFGPMLMPRPFDLRRGEAVSFFMGAGYENFRAVQGPVFGQVLVQAAEGLAQGASLRVEGFRPRHADFVNRRINVYNTPGRVLSLNLAGYPSMALVNVDRGEAYRTIGYPVTLPWMEDLSGLSGSMALMGRMVLALGFGDGPFETPENVHKLKSMGGNVYVSGVGSSIVPNHPLPGALVSNKPVVGSGFAKMGYYLYVLLRTDAYGRYDLPVYTTYFNPVGQPYTPDVVAFDANGLISFAKDEGESAQSIYKSVNLTDTPSTTIDLDPIHLVAFRAAPVAILDLTNPQTLKPFAKVQFIDRRSLAPLSRFNELREANRLFMTFMDPDARVFAELYAGAVGNELAAEIRAFVLGLYDPVPMNQPEQKKAGPAGKKSGGKGDISGPGLLAADTPLLLNMPERISTSMLSVGDRRIALQSRFGLVDERAKLFHQRAADEVARAREVGLSHQERQQHYRAAASYAIINYPVLRNTIEEAILSIVWYLFLLVPFAFFFEKLTFGFKDIRRQLLVQALVFLISFGLLRILHPAFEMIRSSLMILLGFIILLVSSAISLLFTSKFQENLETIRLKQGRLAAAEVNKMGVLATAFMLGLNNMHRRKLRTGLTCGTLVLVTFAMICFTSIHSNLVESTVAIGKAQYAGLMLRGESFDPISESEIQALRQRYGDRFGVVGRWMWLGTRTWDLEQFNPEFNAVYRQPGGAAGDRSYLCDGALVWEFDEPLADKLPYLTRRRWFQSDPKREANLPAPVIVSDAMVQGLGLTIEQIDASPVEIDINGKRFRIWSVFDSRSIRNVRDLDGRDLLPFDTEAIQNIRTTGDDYTILASDDSPRVDPARLLILPRVDLPGVPRGSERLVSAAVTFGDLPYKPARDLVTQFLERLGRTAYFGLEGVAYRGRVARERSLVGLLDLIIPLMIGSLTVLNTMRGSVYERREEIFVYNAVGISPRLVFFIFMAEAFVYAVVGAMLGYLLSQGLGRTLTVLNLTGGLPMTFASMNTVIASMLLMVAVFASTFFPARSAREIAAPAEDAGWSLPEPEDDRIGMDLPFLFDATDRIAVLEFFAMYFRAHGEGGVGRFSCDPPILSVVPSDAQTSVELMPLISTRAWLKPYDLGVSQELRIMLPGDEDTGAHVPKMIIRRLSGTHENWVRLNRVFVAGLRRHFLHWRVVTSDQRTAMFEQAKRQLRESVARQRRSEPRPAADRE